MAHWRRFVRCFGRRLDSAQSTCNIRAEALGGDEEQSRQRASSPRQANKEGGSYVMKDIWQEKQKKWVSFGVELVSQF